MDATKLTLQQAHGPLHPSSASSWMKMSGYPSRPEGEFLRATGLAVPGRRSGSKAWSFGRCFACGEARARRGFG